MYLEYLLLSFDSRLFLGCESVGCGSSGGHVAAGVYITTLTLLLSCSSALQQQVKPCLEKLRQDSDIDVQYFAQEAIEGKACGFT